MINEIIGRMMTEFNDNLAKYPKKQKRLAIDLSFSYNETA